MKKISNNRILPPATVRVYNIVKAAIKSGILKPHRCWCGSTKPTYAHHEFYDEPLNVIWLCPDCHSKIHNRDTWLKPNMFEADEEMEKQAETAWEQSTHVIENESTIKGRLQTAIC